MCSLKGNSRTALWRSGWNFWKVRLSSYRMRSLTSRLMLTSCLLKRSSRMRDSLLWSKRPLRLLLMLKVIQILSSMSTDILIHTDTQLILSFTGLQDTTLALDFRVTVLEENGGGDGNSSVAELEVRVETLEGTVADHETRISAAETDLTGIYSTCYV